MNKNIILYIVILLLAIFLRVYKLGVVPASMTWDEVAIGWNAKTIWDLHIDEYGTRFPMTFRSFGDYKAPFLIYVTAPFVGLLGLNNWVVRFPSVLSGILAVGLVYFLVVEVLYLYCKDKKDECDRQYYRYIPFIVMFLLAVSPWHLMYSRVAFEPNIALTFIVLGMWMLIKGFNSMTTTFLFKIKQVSIKLPLDIIYFLCSGISFAISLYIYHSPKIFVPLISLIVIILYGKQLFITFYKNKLWTILVIVILGLLLFPIIRENLLGAGAKRSGSLIFFNSDGDLRSLDIFLLKDLLTNIGKHLSPLFFIRGNNINLRNSLLHFGLMTKITYLSFLVGVGSYLYSLIKSKFVNKFRLKLFVLLIAWFGIGLIPGILGWVSESPHPLRTLNVLPVVLIFAGIGFVHLIKWLQFWFVKLLDKYKFDLRFDVLYLVIGLLSVLWVVDYVKYLHEYYIEAPIYSAKDWQYGYKQAVILAQKYENDVDQVVISNTYGQAYIFTYFYQNRDPQGVFWGSMRRYSFRDINWDGDQFLHKALLIGTPEDIPANIPKERGEILDEVLFPDGSVAFKVVKIK